MINKKNTLLIVGLLVAMMLMSVTALAAPKTYTVKFSHISPPDPFSQQTSASAVVFKSELERLSGGRIQVKIFPAGQLGDQLSCLQQLKRQTVEICNVASGVLASAYFKPLSVFDMPYLFRSTVVASEVMDVNNPFTKQLLEQLREETGFRVLNLEPMGFRHFTNNIRPIASPEDLRGLKIRTMQVTPHMKMVQALGAKPVPIPFTELYTALQTKVIDGEENPINNILSQKFYQVQKHLTLDGHVLLIGATVMNDKWFQSLPEDLQGAVMEATRAALITSQGLSQLINATGLDELKKNGMEVVALSADQLQAFRDATVGPVKEWLATEVDQKWIDGLMDAIKEAETDVTVH